MRPRGAACSNSRPLPPLQTPQSFRTRLSPILRFWGKVSALGTPVAVGDVGARRCAGRPHLILKPHLHSEWRQWQGWGEERRSTICCCRIGLFKFQTPTGCENFWGSGGGGRGRCVVPVTCGAFAMGFRGEREWGAGSCFW